MNRVFADTGYWVALLNRADGLHGKARAIARTLHQTSVFTTDLVLVEVLNYFAERGPHFRGLAAGLVNEINANPRISVVAFTRELFAQALERYEERSDKGWSFGDCASFAVMEQHHLTEALAYDADFVQAGFVALLRE